MTPRTRNIILIAAAVVVFGVLFVFGVIVGAAVVGYKAAMRSGYEAATLQNIKTIAAIEARHFHSHDRTFGTLDQLINEQELSSKFSGHPTVVDGYVITLSVINKPDGSPWFKIEADPLAPDSGAKHFYLDSTDGRIHANRDGDAGPSDPSN